MKKRLWKGKGKVGLLAVLVMVLCMGIGLTAHAGGFYGNPLVEFSPDAEHYAWTVSEPIEHAYYVDYFFKEGVTPEYWYPKGTRVETGIASSLRELQEGEHYYGVKRLDEVPVKYWEVEHSTGWCIHECTDDYWHGVQNVGPEGNGTPCNKGYYSGWFAYCADCNQKLTHALVYMSKEAAASITSIDMGKGYYYRCPDCLHIDNTVGVIPHECMDISFNQYRVKYNKNVENPLEVGGIMDDSIHMYNNEDLYEGEQIPPITRLSANVYRRPGYAFAGWNTKPDGSGSHYDDCAEIFNLSVYDCNEDPERGTVTLYAQWVTARSTLKIEPGEGKYNDSGGATVVRETYGSTYYVNPEKITPPDGYKVTYDLRGGAFKEETENPALVRKVFSSWELSTPFYGYFANDYYYFEGPDGIEDTLTALYEGGSTILPDAKKEDYAFGGWFTDKECTDPVGFAGQEYTPDEDITLYAQWVNLVLYSEENYEDNEKKGAVDLSWEQKDNYAKSYKLYESTDGENFTLMYGAKKTIDLDALAQDFAYRGVTQTYTVQYSGFYELTAYGAQGGNYTKVMPDGSTKVLNGGKGGKTTARVYLNAGEQLTVAVAGQGGSNGSGKGGYSGGGNGNTYGSGGGVTFVRSDRRGTLMMAGGGGGASESGNGGAGGLQEKNRTDNKTSGENGQAGGGAGRVGGQKGEYIVHVHDEECFVERNMSYEFNDFASNSRVVCELASGNISTVTSKISLYDHTHDIYDNDIYVEIGTYEKPVPVNGNTMMSIPLYYDAWGDGGNLREGACLRVYNQLGVLLHEMDMSNQYTTKRLDRNTHTWYHTIDKRDNPYQISIPEGTTGIYIWMYLPVDKGSVTAKVGDWVTLEIDAISFTGGIYKEPICGMEEGAPVSSKPAYGGSSYINPDYAVYSQSTPGVREGHGAASIKAVSVGYMDTSSIEGVPAPDLAAPDKVDTALEKITMDADGDRAVKLAFETPKDNGTQYWYRAESYKAGTDEKLCDSNITTETLTTGVAGYYYILDTTPVKKVTASNADNKGKLLKNIGDTNTVRVVLAEDIMYLHIAAVDVAGNIGPTADIEVGMDVAWDVSTDQIGVTDVINGVDKDTVYQKDAKTFYVRADGNGPFLLSYKSLLGGKAREDYQIDYQIFDVAMAEGKNQRYITRIPYSIPVSSENKLAVSEFIRQMSGDSILKDAMNTGAYRKGDAMDNYFYQAFTIPKSFHGKSMVVTPVAGATFERDVIYSEWDDDVNHRVTLIADGEAPVISGLELLENKNLINRVEESVTVNLVAVDSLSGVKEFRLEIMNRDNFSKKTYYQEEDGHIEVEITKNEVIFTGDFVVAAYAVDNVGNETEVKCEVTEFALTTEIERILEPHDPIFKCGESGILTITTLGYVDKVEVEFPEEFTVWNPKLNKIYYYTDATQYKQEEQLQFMIPLQVPPNQQYTVTVRAYKGERKLEEYPSLSTVSVGGSVLDELRTRLR